MRSSCPGGITGGGKKGTIPALWDGKAAVRIADHLQAFLAIGQHAFQDR
jgi:hypothetical protein